jgi:transposase
MNHLYQPLSTYIDADKGYDSKKFRTHIHDKGAIPVIPRRKNNFHAIASRYDKLEQNYASMVALAFTNMWLPIHY